MVAAGQVHHLFLKHAVEGVVTCRSGAMRRYLLHFKGVLARTLLLLFHCCVAGLRAAQLGRHPGVEDGARAVHDLGRWCKMVHRQLRLGIGRHEGLTGLLREALRNVVWQGGLEMLAHFEPLIYGGLLREIALPRHR